MNITNTISIPVACGISMSFGLGLGYLVGKKVCLIMKSGLNSDKAKKVFMAYTSAGFVAVIALHFFLLNFCVAASTPANHHPNKNLSLSNIVAVLNPGSLEDLSYLPPMLAYAICFVSQQDLYNH